MNDNNCSRFRAAMECGAKLSDDLLDHLETCPRCSGGMNSLTDALKIPDSIRDHVGSCETRRETIGRLVHRVGQWLRKPYKPQVAALLFISVLVLGTSVMERHTQVLKLREENHLHRPFVFARNSAEKPSEYTETSRALYLESAHHGVIRGKAACDLVHSVSVRVTPGLAPEQQVYEDDQVLSGDDWATFEFPLEFPPDGRIRTVRLQFETDALWKESSRNDLASDIMTRIIKVSCLSAGALVYVEESGGIVRNIEHVGKRAYVTVDPGTPPGSWVSLAIKAKGDPGWSAMEPREVPPDGSALEFNVQLSLDPIDVFVFASEEGKQHLFDAITAGSIEELGDGDVVTLPPAWKPIAWDTPVPQCAAGEIDECPDTVRSNECKLQVSIAEECEADFFIGIVPHLRKDRCWIQNDSILAPRAAKTVYVGMPTLPHGPEKFSVLLLACAKGAIQPDQVIGVDDLETVVGITILDKREVMREN